jgi:dihydrofolate synthase/folylpolyglutamate synthase
VAGTNGKGSTIAFLRAMLEAAGHRVHQYTSPHLIRFHERIRLALSPGQSRFIDESVLTTILEECEQANGGDPVTFFEVTTAAAFIAFARIPADVVLLEVGLGGRLDATNVVDHPELSVITPVSVDHVGFLGAELAGIAGEKAGILKPGVPAIIGPQPPVVLAAIEARAAEVGALLSVWGRDWNVSANLAQITVSGPNATFVLPMPALYGAHQIQNAGLAVACLTNLPSLTVDETSMAAGIATAVWPGRLQRLPGKLASRLPQGADLWLDGGHNPAAAQALSATFRDWSTTDPKPLMLIVGMLDTKETADFLQAFSGQAEALMTVPVPGSDASLTPQALAAMAKDAGLTALPADNLGAALDHIAKTRDGSPPRVLICGSLYLAGAALSADGHQIS